MIQFIWKPWIGQLGTDASLVDRVKKTSRDPIECPRGLCRATNASFAYFCRRCGNSLAGSNAANPPNTDSISV